MTCTWEGGICPGTPPQGMCHSQCVCLSECISTTGQDRERDIACSLWVHGARPLSKYQDAVSRDVSPPLSPAAVTGPPDPLLLDPDPVCCLLYAGSGRPRAAAVLREPRRFQPRESPSLYTGGAGSAVCAAPISGSCRSILTLPCRTSRSVDGPVGGPRGSSTAAPAT